MSEVRRREAGGAAETTTFNDIDPTLSIAKLIEEVAEESDVLQKKLTWDSTPTAGSSNPVTSDGIKKAIDEAGTPSDYEQVKQQVQSNTMAISGIEGKIPSAATAQNKLVDTQTMNSSIATNTATFRGTYNLVTGLNLTTSATHEQVAAAIKTKLAALLITPENNDYCFVQIPKTDAEAAIIVRVDRYKCTVADSTTSWAYEWSLNNSSFTSGQWEAINSGITSGMVQKLGGIAEGAQVNVIEQVQINGTPITPTNKTVNVPAATVEQGTKADNSVQKMGTDQTMTVGLTVTKLTVGSRAVGSTIGIGSTSEGFQTTASGTYSHAEGGSTVASGEAAHAEGWETTASGDDSHTEGHGTIAQNLGEHAQGTYNVSNTGDDPSAQTIHSVGIGGGGAERMNAFEVMKSGRVFILGIGGYDGTNSNPYQYFETQDVAEVVNSLLEGKIDTAFVGLGAPYREKSYAVDEICTYHGSFYKCIAAYVATHLTNPPDEDGVHWQMIKASDLFKSKQNVVVSPTTSGGTAEFIDTITQNENGVITATKKKVDFSSVAKHTLPYRLPDTCFPVHIVSDTVESYQLDVTISDPALLTVVEEDGEYILRFFNTDAAAKGSLKGYVDVAILVYSSDDPPKLRYYKKGLYISTLTFNGTTPSEFDLEESGDSLSVLGTLVQPLWSNTNFKENPRMGVPDDCNVFIMSDGRRYIGPAVENFRVDSFPKDLPSEDSGVTLEEVHFGSATKTVSGAFNGNITGSRTNVKKVVFLSEMESLKGPYFEGDDAFYGCYSLKEIDLRNTTQNVFALDQSIAGTLFDFCPISSIVVSDGLYMNIVEAARSANQGTGEDSVYGNTNISVLDVHPASLPNGNPYDDADHSLVLHIDSIYPTYLGQETSTMEYDAVRSSYVARNIARPYLHEDFLSMVDLRELLIDNYIFRLDSANNAYLWNTMQMLGNYWTIEFPLFSLTEGGSTYNRVFGTDDDAFSLWYQSGRPVQLKAFGDSSHICQVSPRKAVPMVMRGMMSTVSLRMAGTSMAQDFKNINSSAQTKTWYIGCPPDASSHAITSAMCGGLRVYNRCLSDVEVLAHYEEDRKRWPLTFSEYNL